MELLLESRGEKKSDGKVKILNFNEPEAGAYTYGGFNSTAQERQVVFDCTNNRGMLFSNKNPVVTMKIPPNSYRVFFTVMCDPLQDEFEIKPQIKFI